MDYPTGGGAAGSKGLSASDRSVLVNQLREQVAVANAQEILQQVTEKCFNLCVTRPSTSVSSSEQKCLSFCMDRYFDAFSIVSKAYMERLQKEMANSR